MGLALLATGSNAFGPVVERVRGDIFSSAESGNRQARIVKAIETLRPKGELGLIRNPRHIRHPRSRWDERDLVITPQPYTAKTDRAAADLTGCGVRLRHETPKGDVHLHAEEITADGYAYTIDAPKPPKHGPGHEDWMTKKQADEMLTELRAIRKLMEEKAK